MNRDGSQKPTPYSIQPLQPLTSAESQELTDAWWMILVQLQTPCKESGTTLLMSSTAIADFVPRHGSGGSSFCVLASRSMHAITAIIQCIQEFTSS